jgi:hypothetical protein
VFNFHTQATELVRFNNLHQREITVLKDDLYEGTILLKSFLGFPDMVNMEILNDAELLENLKWRFHKD